MPQEYTVQQGDCISSIAVRHGFFPDTLWDDAANADLKAKREEPNVLLPGDVVVIPDKREKSADGGSEKRHRFRRKGVPEKLRLRLLDDEGQPFANQAYRLDIDGQTVNGTTGGDGMIEVPIHPA